MGDPLFVVADMRELEFEASVPSEFVRVVRPGAAVRLEVTGFETGAIRGKVSRVNAQADPATRQVKVYVTVPNADARLVGGLFASGHVVTQEARKVLAVPTAAVRHEGARRSRGCWRTESSRRSRSRWDARRRHGPHRSAHGTRRGRDGGDGTGGVVLARTVRARDREGELTPCSCRT
jgi:hypothetical protein